MPEPAPAPPGSRAAVWPLATLMALAPWPYAGNLPWLEALLATTAALMLACAALSGLARHRSPRVPAIAWLATPPFAAALLWGWLQAHPGLPPAWSHPAWAELAPAPTAALVGLDRAETMAALARLLGYGCAVLLAVRIARSVRGTDRLLLAFVTSATAVAAYGIAVWLLGSHTILWFPREFYTDRLSASFINPNNFATYANLAILACLALIARRLRALGLGGRGLKIAARRVLMGLVERRGHLLVCLSILTVATLASQSRGGLLSLLAALFAFVILHTLSGLRWRGLLVALLLAVTATVGYIEIAGQETLQRIADALAQPDLNEGMRLTMFAETEELVALRPWLGHGLGNFERAYRLYQDVPFPAVIDKAHNTWLETAAELGLPAASSLLLSVLLLLGAACRNLLRGGPGAVPGVLAVSAAILVGTHALVDFSLQIPAVALCFAALLGLGVGPRQRAPAAR